MKITISYLNIYFLYPQMWKNTEDYLPKLPNLYSNKKKVKKMINKGYLSFFRKPKIKPIP
jgi:hypothetical protein